MEWDFAQNTMVASLDKVPQDFKGLYVQDGDKFKLGSDHAGVQSAVSAIQGLNTALRASRAEAKAHKDKIIDLSPLADFGTDPASILEGFNTKLKDAGKGDVAKAVASAKEQWDKAHEKAIKTSSDQNAALKGQLNKLLIGMAATSALAEADAIDADLVMPHVERQVRAIEENGEVKVVVINAAGEARYSGAAGGGYMTIKELVGEMKGQEKYGPLFKSAAPSGGGSQPTRRTGTQLPQGAERTSVQKIAAGLKTSGSVQRGR